MKKKITGVTLWAMLFAVCASAEAQQQTKIPKIGELRASANLSPRSKLFREALRDLGYVGGKNIAFEYRFSEGKLDRLPRLAEELARLKVNVLIASSTAEALAFKNATRTIPIVLVGISDPIGSGLVDSLARPGANITGITNIAAALTGKRLELLKESVPKVSRVALLWDPKEPSSKQQWNESQISARELGLQLHSMEVSSADRIESAFKDATMAGSTALAAVSTAFVNANAKRIVEFATKHRLPAIGARNDFVESGGLLSYGPDMVEIYRRAAWMVDKILKGAKPADIPVEQPTKFELVINLRTAKQIGLTIPQSVLFRADKVIK